MLKELKFVQGAVAKKELLPALTHFRIENGFVRSFNGTLALCSPIAFDIDCTPKAAPFVKAIQNCKETVSLSITKAGRLSVKSGSFKAFIDCVDEVTPHVEPEGDQFEINGEALLNAFKTIVPFIGDDAARPWSNGILLSNQSAYATNNVILVEYWVGSVFPFICNIPKAAIKEMIRINEPPIYAQATETSISFHYEDGRWVRTALYDIDWPDLSRILDQPNNPAPVHQDLFEALDVVKPFANDLGCVYFHKEGVTTSLKEGDGASYDLKDFHYEGAYRIEMLLSLKDIISTIDFTSYPKPSIFYGDRLRGAIVGMSV